MIINLRSSSEYQGGRNIISCAEITFIYEVLIWVYNLILISKDSICISSSTSIGRKCEGVIAE
jgi:hypothetical protein